MSSLESKKEKLQIIGDGLKTMADMWILLIIEILRDGPKRFSEIEKLAQINTRTLSDRLRKMEDMHMITKNRPDQEKSAIFYELSSKGEKSLKILDLLVDYIKEYL